MIMGRGEFVTVKCGDCGNEQIVFSKPAEDVACVVCDEVLVESRGGEGRFQARVLDAVA